MMLDALAQFLEPAEIAIVGVADGAERNVEVVLGISEIGAVLADIVIHAAAAQVGAGQSEVDGVFLRDDADALVAIDENLVAGEEIVELVDLALELLDEGAGLFDKAGRQVADLAADARVAGGEARAGERARSGCRFSRAR